MSTKHIRVTAGILLVFHLFVIAAMDWGHIDFVSTNGRSTEHVASHTCGAWELHQSLDSQHFCLLCLRNANFVAFSNPSSVPMCVPQRTLPSGHSSCNVPDEALVSSYQRGPPLQSHS